MTNPNASDRPTSEQALEMFKQLARSKSWLARRCPLHPIGGSPRSAFDDALTLIWEEFVVRLWRECTGPIHHRRTISLTQEP
jgi:hypothetical protein